MIAYDAGAVCCLVCSYVRAYFLGDDCSMRYCYAYEDHAFEAYHHAALPRATDTFFFFPVHFHNLSNSSCTWVVTFVFGRASVLVLALYLWLICWSLLQPAVKPVESRLRCTVETLLYSSAHTRCSVESLYPKISLKCTSIAASVENMPLKDRVIKTTTGTCCRQRQQGSGVECEYVPPRATRTGHSYNATPHVVSY